MTVSQSSKGILTDSNRENEDEAAVDEEMLSLPRRGFSLSSPAVSRKGRENTSMVRTQTHPN